MNFSEELVELAKAKANLKTDAELLRIVHGITKQNLSSAKSGKRDLTENQALEIAEKCGINPEWVLVSLAAEVAKRKNNESVRSVWAGLAKKLAANGLALVLVGFLSISAGNQVGKHVLLRRSRLFA